MLGGENIVDCLKQTLNTGYDGIVPNTQCTSLLLFRSETDG